MNKKNHIDSDNDAPFYDNNKYFISTFNICHLEIWVPSQEILFYVLCECIKQVKYFTYIFDKIMEIEKRVISWVIEFKGEEITRKITISKIFYG